MVYRKLGNYTVSPIGFGTAALIHGYGPNKNPSKEKAIELIQYAISRGINFIDTAESYAGINNIVKAAINRHEVIVCNKVMPFDFHYTLKGNIHLSHREVSRWPNHVSGVSVYSPEYLSVHINKMSVAEIPLNILDQRFIKFFTHDNISFIARSVYLQGALSPAYSKFHPKISEAIVSLCENLKIDAYSLPEIALRYVLSFNKISSVIIGFTEFDQIDKAIAIAEAMPYNVNKLFKWRSLSMDDIDIIDPRRWRDIPIPKKLSNRV